MAERPAHDREPVDSEHDTVAGSVPDRSPAERLVPAAAVGGALVVAALLRRLQVRRQRADAMAGAARRLRHRVGGMAPWVVVGGHLPHLRDVVGAAERMTGLPGVGDAAGHLAGLAPGRPPARPSALAGAAHPAEGRP